MIINKHYCDGDDDDVDDNDDKMKGFTDTNTNTNNGNYNEKRLYIIQSPFNALPPPSPPRHHPDILRLT